MSAGCRSERFSSLPAASERFAFFASGSPVNSCDFERRVGSEMRSVLPASWSAFTCTLSKKKAKKAEPLAPPPPVLGFRV